MHGDKKKSHSQPISLKVRSMKGGVCYLRAKWVLWISLGVGGGKKGAHHFVEHVCMGTQKGLDLDKVSRGHRFPVGSRSVLT